MHSIRTRIALISIALCAIPVIALQTFHLVSLVSQHRQSKAQVQVEQLDAFDQLIRSQVQTAHGLLARAYALHKAGKLSLAAAKAQAMAWVRPLRYGKSGYFWIDTYEGKLLVLPSNPAAEGQIRIDLRDKRGKYLIREIIANGRKSGGGFTDYYFPKPGKREAQRKRSYSLAFAPFRWVIGTGNYVDDVDAAVAKVAAKHDRQMRSAIIGAVVSVLLALGLAVLFAFLAARFLSRPIESAVELTRVIASGDLRVDMPEEVQSRRDELGTLGSSMQRMTEQLREVIGDMSGLSGELGVAIDEIAAGNDSLAQRTSAQASATSQIAATVEEATATMEMVSQQLEQAKSGSTKAREVAAEGGEVLRQALAAMNAIRESSTEIATIIGLIDEIAFQTQILSINATIEAARAGQHGRGFAVVAAEVRRLAGRSSEAAAKIRELVAESTEQVESGSQLAGRGGEAIAGIVETTTELASTMVEVAAAGAQINAGVGEIGGAVAQLDTTSQDNAALVEETAAAAAHVREQARALRELAARFELDQRDRGHTLSSSSSHDAADSPPGEWPAPSAVPSGSVPHAHA